MIRSKLWIAVAGCVLFSGFAPGLAFAQAPNTLTPQQQQEGWQLLFNGHNFDGWHSYLQKGVGKDWSVVHGAIQLKKTNQDPPADYADIVTDGEYKNFDLKLEWKARPCIDSGVMFYVHESPQYHNTYDTGIEMQIADLACTVPDSRILKERSGDIFDMISDPVEWVRPAGQWNQFEIIADHGHLQLFQNGHKVIDTTLWDANWNQLIAGTKFAHFPGYSKYHIGHISLQGTEPKGKPGVKLVFRNIMIKKLD
jgi:3-keto-disaccharide hydrolase